MKKTISKKQLASLKKYNISCFFNTDGQISLDFIAGVAIFMVTFIFLFQTLTSFFIPFQSNSDEIKSMADRVGMTLAETTSGLANDPTDSNIISVRRAELFNQRMNTTSGYNEVLEDLGLSSETTHYNLNVSLCNMSNSLYLNATGGVVLHNGPIPPCNVNIAQTVRIVYVKQDEAIAEFEDNIAQLYIKVW